MQFLSTIFLAATALASMAVANTVHFVNQDSTTRTIYFTGNPGMATYSELTVPGLSTANQTFATGWIGNWYSVSEGAANVPGMLGEVRFDGFAGATYFDVSAIVNPSDNEGVKQIFPKNSNTPVSGCQSYPCTNQYNKADDIATLSTDDSELVCLLGNLSNERRRGLVARVSRDFVVS
jgi:hypothetical protein